jgi:hypothetical protein
MTNQTQKQASTPLPEQFIGYRDKLQSGETSALMQAEELADLRFKVNVYSTTRFQHLRFYINTGRMILNDELERI